LAFSPIGLAAAAPIPLPETPSRPGAGPTKINYAVWLGDVMRIDSVAQTFQTNFLLVLRWQDPSLKHPGPGAKQFVLKEVWHPPLLIANESGDSKSSLPEVVDVSPDGTVVYRQRFIGSYTHRLDLRAFPFDHAMFRVQIVVPGHYVEELQFEPDPSAVAAGMPNGVGRPESLTMQDWRVLSTGAGPMPYPVSPKLQLAGFAFGFSAARNAQYYVIKVLLPLFLIVMMSWAVFWIEPSESGPQFSIAVTSMLTLIAYRFAVEANTPKLPYLTRLDAFILAATLLVFLSLIEVIIVTKLVKRDRLERARAIDRRCRWAVPLVFAVTTIVIFAR
jgi:hypothetical protein